MYSREGTQRLHENRHKLLQSRTRTLRCALWRCLNSFLCQHLCTLTWVGGGLGGRAIAGTRRTKAKSKDKQNQLYAAKGTTHQHQSLQQSYASSFTWSCLCNWHAFLLKDAHSTLHGGYQQLSTPKQTEKLGYPYPMEQLGTYLTERSCYTSDTTKIIPCCRVPANGIKYSCTYRTSQQITDF